MHNTNIFLLNNSCNVLWIIFVTSTSLYNTVYTEMTVQRRFYCCGPICNTCCESYLITLTTLKKVYKSEAVSAPYRHRGLTREERVTVVEIWKESDERSCSDSNRFILVFEKRVNLLRVQSAQPLRETDAYEGTFQPITQYPVFCPNRLIQ